MDKLINENYTALIANAFQKDLQIAGEAESESECLMLRQTRQCWGGHIYLRTFRPQKKPEDKEYLLDKNSTYTAGR